MVQGTTPAHKGLAPSRLIPYLRYDKDTHAGHTHCVHVWQYRPHERLVIVKRFYSIFNFNASKEPALIPINPYFVSPFLVVVPFILYSNISVLNFLLAEPATIIFPPANTGPKTNPIGVKLSVIGTEPSVMSHSSQFVSEDSKFTGANSKYNKYEAGLCFN